MITIIILCSFVIYLRRRRRRDLLKRMFRQKKCVYKRSRDRGSIFFICFTFAVERTKKKFQTTIITIREEQRATYGSLV